VSWRRSLSFATDEEDLKDDYDSNGGSKYAKECMKFFKNFKDKVFIVPDGLSIGYKPRVVNNEHKKSIKSLIK
jgi:hypothetical protein